MAVRIEKSGSVWTLIHSRPEARNAMDPDSADALQAAFLKFGLGLLRRLRILSWRRLFRLPIITG